MEHLCPPREHNGVIVRCGRVVLDRDPTNPAEACPGGLMVCDGCADDFRKFLKAAYDARARRKEWEAD